MNPDQEFNEIVGKYSLNDEVIKKILRIFEGTGGNQIVNEDVIPRNSKIKDFLILSDEITRALNIVHSKIREISEGRGASSGAMFYFSQYGGSKTQFLNLVANQLAIEVPNCIPVIFEGLNQLNPITMFEKIFPRLILVISRTREIYENYEKYQNFSRDLQNNLANVQMAIKQWGNLKKAEELIKEFQKVRNPDFLKRVDEMDELLHSSILVDSLQVLDYITRLMKFCSQSNLVFLFMFDEVDLWLDESADDVKFSKEFNRITTFMKNVFDIPANNVKCFFIFACHDRVNRLFIEKQQRLEIISPAGSRLNRLYNSSERILEPGNYGNQIDKAMITLAAYYYLANGRIPFDFSIINMAIPIIGKKYKAISRRQANSRIFQFIKNYQYLSSAIEAGSRNWEPQAIHFGKLLQDLLPAVFGRLNIKFIREDVPIDPTGTRTKNKLDGYFVNETIGGKIINTCVEIKLTKEFKKEKGYQALEWLQLHHAEHMIMIIFSPVTLDDINGALVEYAARNGYNNQDNALLGRLHFILVQNPVAFAPVIGIDNTRTEPEKAEKFFDAFADWLEFFGDITTQYNQAKRDIGIEPVILAPQPPSQHVVEDQKDKQPQQPPVPPKIDLDPDQQTILNLLTRMQADRQFTPSGRMSKQKIADYVRNKSLGIADLEAYFEKMKAFGIIERIMEKQVQFASNIAGTGLSDELKRVVLEKYRSSKRNAEGVLDRFV